MLEKIEQIIQDIQSLSIKSRDEAESFRLRYLSKKGIISDLFMNFRTLPADQKKLLGQRINEVKKMAQEKIDSFLSSTDSPTSEKQKMDLTRPGEPRPLGSRHPVSIVRKEIIDIFSRVGFVISEGPEIEDDWHQYAWDVAQAGTDLLLPQIARCHKKSSSLRDDLGSHQRGEVLDGLRVVAVEHDAVQ